MRTLVSNGINDTDTCDSDSFLIFTGKIGQVWLFGVDFFPSRVIFSNLFVEEKMGY